MEENRLAQSAFTPEAAAIEPASPAHPSPPSIATAADVLDFEPVPLRYRADGLTPQKQREYVEALADCGVARQAAALIGVSEQAINRVRRRADARAFDLACEGAHRFGARRLRSIAYERAIEGTVKRHYFHGELKSEEVVYDNRLLLYLLGKTAHLAEPPPEAEAVAENWEKWMEAIEQGLPPPSLDPPDEEAEAGDGEQRGRLNNIDNDGFWGDEVWEKDGAFWTDFPPPAGFDGVERSLPGSFNYERVLSPAEQAVIDADRAAQHAEFVARRDLYFGFKGGSRSEDEPAAEKEVLPPGEAETYETSEPFDAVALRGDSGRDEVAQEVRGGPRIRGFGP